MSNLSITSASVLAGADSPKQSGVAGVAIAAGDALYIDASDSGKLKLAVATSAAASVFAGIALHGAAAGQPITYLTSSTITIGATLHVGTIYVVSATAGKICPVADLVAGNYVTIIGMPTTTGILDVYPRSSGLALAA
jgi:hypothetical protein